MPRPQNIIFLAASHIYKACPLPLAKMSKRPRRAPARFDGEGDDAALESARRATATMASVHVPPAPVFRPTVAEWADPCAYLASVAHAGACGGARRSGARVRVFVPFAVRALRA